MKRIHWISIIIAVAVMISYALVNADKTIERDDLIRLHIIANSDSPEDQALKNKIRDQLLLAFGQTFKDAPTMENARTLIGENLIEFERIALAEIYEEGYQYPVNAKLGIYPFPTKVYGDIVYPAGRYEALRVVIGKGQGANWWCVMFPPLCFVDISSGVTRTASGVTRKPNKVGNASSLENQNNNKGPIKPTEAGEKVAVKYTFKLVEWWKAIQPRIIRIFSSRDGKI